MNRAPELLFSLCIALMLCSCSHRTDKAKILRLSDISPLNLSMNADTDTIIEIKNWLAIGPFDFNSFFTDPAKSFSRDDLKSYGIKEGSIDDASIEKLQKRGLNVFLIDEPSPQIKMFRYISGSIKNKSNFYLHTLINSTRPRNVALIVDGSYSYDLWLNGDRLIQVVGKYNVNKAGNRFVRLSLMEGQNILSVKLNRGTNKNSWDLIAAIATAREGERIFLVNYAGDFVLNPIVENSLEIYAGPYLEGKLELTDDSNRTLAAASFKAKNTNAKPFVLSGLDKLDDGFYKAILTLDGQRLEEMIYKGNYFEFAKKTKALIAQTSPDGRHAEDLNAAMQRVDFLNAKPKEDPVSSDETRFVNRNRVFWGYSLYQSLSNNASTRLMTYSDKDGSSGAFIFHHSGKPQQHIPLLIIVPPALQSASMIEDWYASNLEQIETDNALAAQYGIAVAWIHAAGKNYSATKTEKEISAIIYRLQSEYDIDAKKIFIMGDCEGGRRALVQLALSPNRYAACVAASPVTLSGEPDGVPINLLPQMPRIPILIRHGTDDNVSPVENSRRFYAEAQKLNMPVQYLEVEGSHVNVAKDGHRYVFEFLNQQLSGEDFNSNGSKPESEGFNTNNARQDE